MKDLELVCSKEQIEEVYAKQLEAPETRIAQKTLAWEVVKDIHGKEEADNAVLVSEKLFKGDFNGLSVKDINKLKEDVLIEEAEMRVSIRTIYIDIEYAEKATLVEAKSKAEASIEKLDEEILEYYDINFIISTNNCKYFLNVVFNFIP